MPYDNLKVNYNFKSWTQMAEWYRALILERQGNCRSGSNQPWGFCFLLLIFAFFPNFEGKFPDFAKFREVGT